MSFTLTCFTLHDITQTGITGRALPGPSDELSDWLSKRNTQNNFDTVLQAISLRSQPENTSTPEQTTVSLNDDMFGFLFSADEELTEVPCWSFDFDIMHTQVFDDGISELGLLYADCDNIPMIKCGVSWDKLPAFLDTSDELRNIFFKVKNEKT